MEVKVLTRSADEVGEQRSMKIDDVLHKICIYATSTVPHEEA
jgi:hypothetical protein